MMESARTPFGSAHSRATPCADTQGAGLVYPGATWDRADPQALGWSVNKLEQAGQYLQTVPAGSAIVIDRGRIVAEWGDPAKRVKSSSTRKSLLSALYGIYVHQGRLDLTKTLEQLGIDDDPPLTPAERQATLRMVLQARSGIYRSFVGGTPAMRAKLPERGSHAPGTFWNYNNWDFNVLGTIFEQQLKTKIGAAFYELIARPIQMQDYRLEDVYYVRAATGKAADETSVHPAYQFRMTARDMARFGYLFLRQGRWNEAQIIASAWVQESTTSYSDAGKGNGYGYLWWINGWPGVAEKNYSARGALGKNVVVFPDRDLVVVYLNYTEFPDDSSAVPGAELRRLPNMTNEQMGMLLRLILDAQHP